jgi:hypothetical protein
VVLKGDVSRNGIVDIIDALLVAQCVASLVPCASYNSYAADVNCSEKIDIMDALLIARYVAGLIPALGCQLKPASVEE